MQIRIQHSQKGTIAQIRPSGHRSHQFREPWVKTILTVSTFAGVRTVDEWGCFFSYYHYYHFYIILLASLTTVCLHGTHLILKWTQKGLCGFCIFVCFRYKELCIYLLLQYRSFPLRHIEQTTGVVGPMCYTVTFCHLLNNAWTNRVVYKSCNPMAIFLFSFWEFCT